MSVFIFRYAKSPSAPSLRDVDLTPYLPRRPLSEESLSRGSAEIRIASYGAALDKPPMETPGGFTFAQGYLPSEALPSLSERLIDDRPITLLDHPESFCGITYRNGTVGLVSAGTGADQLFYYETDNAFFATNRHNLLGPFVDRLSLRKESFWWMAGRTHLGDAGSYWNQIHRTMPSRKYLFDGHLRTISTNYEGLFEPIAASDLPETMADAVSHFDRVMGDIAAPKRISLTGGKDSRAILGLLSSVGQAENLKVNTTGTYFSPDVMAARHLTDALGIAERHSISRPRVAQPAGDMAPLVADDLLLDFAGRSLADISKFSFAGDLVLGGHEAGIKSPLNKLNLDAFIQSRRFWTDDRKVLAPEVRCQLTASYQERLREALSDVPPAYFDKIEGLEFRLPHRNSANITASHVGGSQLHPFYDGKIVRIICGIDPAALSAQYIPYYFAALARADLVSPRFADDAWPEQLGGLLGVDNLVQNNRVPTPRKPFEFRSYFPTEKRFGMFGHRLDLCDLSGSKLLDYLHDNASFFDYLDMSQVVRLVDKAGTEKSFREMYVHLGLLKSALVHACCDNLFSFSAHAAIASTVEDFLSPRRTNAPIKVPVHDYSELLEDRLRRYEESIGEMEQRIVDIEECASAPPGSATEASVNVSEPMECNAVESSRRDGRIGFADLLSASNGEFVTLSRDGLHVGTVDNCSALVLTGKLFASALTSRSALVLIEDVETAPFLGFLHSPTLGGYFRYISPDPATGYFKVDFRPDPNSNYMRELRVSLRSWRNEGPLLFAGKPALVAEDG